MHLNACGPVDPTLLPVMGKSIFDWTAEDVHLINAAWERQRAEEIRAAKERFEFDQRESEYARTHNVWQERRHARRLLARRGTRGRRGARAIPRIGRIMGPIYGFATRGRKGTMPRCGLIVVGEPR